MKNKLIKFFKRKNIDTEFINTLSYLLSNHGKEFNLSNRLSISLFLGQVKAEIYIRKNGTIRTRESLDYTVKALYMFPFFRKNKSLARKLGRSKKRKARQKEIANYVYSDINRKKGYKLGNIRKDDGYNFRGVGILQSTGRENITKDSETLKDTIGLNITLNDEPLQDVLGTYSIGILLGMAHWKRKKIYLKKTTNEVTDIINKGLNGKKRKLRERYTREAYLLFK